MRIVLCHPGPSFSVHDLYVGWMEAFRELDIQVVPFNLDSRLSLYDSVYFNVSEGQFKRALTTEQAIEMAVNGLNATLYKVVPDVLMVISGFLIPADILDHARRYGTKVVVVHTELPYETTREVELAQHADINLINDSVNIGDFPPGTYYQPHCYRPAVHRPGPFEGNLTSDLAFVGTGFESRIALFEAMCEAGLTDHDVALAGNWQRLAEGSPLRKFLAHDIQECVDNSAATLLYRGAKVGLNLYRREHDEHDDATGWAIGPREVEMAACGLPFLRDRRGEGDELFPRHLQFDGAQEAVHHLRWWLNNPDQREAAALAGRAAIRDRTFTHAAIRLLRRLDHGPI